MTPHGGKREGAGRKPSPNRLANIQAKVKPEVKEWLVVEAELQNISTSKLIAQILDERFQITLLRRRIMEQHETTKNSLR